jgi:hypothetical protein
MFVTLNYATQYGGTVPVTTQAEVLQTALNDLIFYKVMPLYL